MRRIIPLASTIAVIAATAVSAGQRTMEIPGQKGSGPAFAPPMFEAGAKPAPPVEWPSDKRTVSPEQASENKEGALPEQSALEKEVGSTSAGPASTAKGTDASAAEKKPEPSSSVPTKASSSLKEKSVTKAASSATMKQTASSNQHEAGNDVPGESKKRDAVRDVTAAPHSDEASLEKAKDQIRAQMKDMAKAEAAEGKTVQIEGRAAPAEAPSRVEKPVKVERPHFTGSQGKAKPVTLAALKGDEESGDRLLVNRAFHAWTLKCAMQISRNEKICAIHQTINESGPDRFAWQLATNSSGKPIVVFDFSAEADADPGLQISIAGFDKSIPATDWSCEATRCTGSMPIIGPVSSWFTNTSQIRFTYRKNGAPVTVTAAMTGFEQAVTALQNPLGLKTGPEQANNPSLGKTAQAN